MPLIYSKFWLRFGSIVQWTLALQCSLAALFAPTGAMLILGFYAWSSAYAAIFMWRKAKGVTTPE